MSSKAFLFDIGNVLVHFDFGPAGRRFARQSKIGAEASLTALKPLKDDLESGRITDAEFVRQGMVALGFKGSEAEFVAIWGDIFSENLPMIEMVRQLAGRHPLYLLSNTSGLHKQWLFEKFDVFRHFAGGIYSHEAGCMKPHDAIFDLALRTYGLDPAQTFYIDDLAENIATGGRLGLVSHHYHPQRHEDFLAAVKKWLAA